MVLGAVGKETLDEAFSYLEERLDSEEDMFEAAVNFRQMTWNTGEPVQDFFTRYLEEGVKAGLTARAVCVFMVSQVPSETQQKLKEWVKLKADTLSVDEALQFCTQLRKAFTERGLPLDRGTRMHYVAKVEAGSAGEDSSMEEPPLTNVQFVRTKGRTKKGQRRELRCYLCSSTEHLVRSCPNRYCSMCGEAGHRPAACPRLRDDRGSKTGKSDDCEAR